MLQSKHKTAPYILLAEDMCLNQQIICHILQRHGYNVDCVENGRLAISALCAFPYDLLLMDISMPEMDGLTATRIIRQFQTPLCQTPIIALSAYDSPLDKSNADKAGMSGYLCKPICRKLLINTIENALTAKNTPLSRLPCQSVLTQHQTLNPITLKTVLTGMNNTMSQDTIKKLIQEIKASVKALQQAAQDQNPFIFEQQSHLLKGIAATFGMEKLQHEAARANQHIHCDKHQMAFTQTDKISTIVEKTAQRLASFYSLPSFPSHYEACAS